MLDEPTHEPHEELLKGCNAGPDANETGTALHEQNQMAQEKPLEAGESAAMLSSVQMFV